MAGLRERGKYVVLTRESEGEVADIHDRTPVILEADDASRWLSDGELADPPKLEGTAVSTRVNRIENDDPECVEPLENGSFEFD